MTTYETPGFVWAALTEQLNPVSGIKDDPEAIRITPVQKRNSLMFEARVTKPIPRSTPFNIDEAPEDNDERPSNDTIDMYSGDAVRWLRQQIADQMSIFTATGPDTSIELQRMELTEEAVVSHYEIKRVIPRGETKIDDDLVDLLIDDGYLDSPEHLSHGTFEVIGNPDTEYSHTDGTIFRRTQTPHEMWAGLETFEEWLDRAADTPEERDRLANKDEFTEHIHPSIYGLDDDSPYFEWQNQAEEALFESIEFANDTIISNQRFDQVYLDNAIVSLRGAVTVGPD